HAVGVVHRDVKPENLFTTTDANGRLLVKVLDFGVAEVACSVDEERTVVGTLEYIAPDVLLGELESDVQSDLYALGIVAFECLTGRVPFPAKNVGELVLAHSKGVRPRLADLREDAPEELDVWMDSAIARDAKARFASAKEMADALDEAMAEIAPRSMSKPVSAVPSPLSSSGPPRRLSGPMP